MYCKLHKRWFTMQFRAFASSKLRARHSHVFSESLYCWHFCQSFYGIWSAYPACLHLVPTSMSNSTPQHTNPPCACREYETTIIAIVVYNCSPRRTVVMQCPMWCAGRCRTIAPHPSIWLATCAIPANNTCPLSFTAN